MINYDDYNVDHQALMKLYKEKFGKEIPDLANEVQYWTLGSIADIIDQALLTGKEIQEIEEDVPEDGEVILY